MMEEVKKKNKSKKTEVKKATTKKTPATKKSDAKKKIEVKKVAKKTTTKKNEIKEQAAKKVQNKKSSTSKEKNIAPKKLEQKITKTTKEPVKEEKKINDKVISKKEVINETELNKEKNLEKTLIFDGTQTKNLREVVDKLEEENIVLKDKVIKRSKAKKVICISLVILILSAITITTAYCVNVELELRRNSQTLNSNIYEKVADNIKEGNIKKEESNNNGELTAADVIEEKKYSNITTISLATFEEKIMAKEDMGILISSSTCYYCITYEPTVNESLANIEKNIYRLDVTRMSKEEKTRLRTYYSFTKTPTLFYIKDGIVTTDLVGKQENEKLDNWVKENFK